MVRPPNLQNHKFTGVRRLIAKFVEDSRFSKFITAVILINAITLGLETDAEIMASYGTILHTIDQIALCIFVIEILLKLSIYRLSFFREGWNVFDFTIVGIALLPATGPFSVLRALRIVRVLRLVSIVPQMRRVITALLHAVPGMTSIMAVLFIIFYVASVLVTKLFGVNPEFEELFGSLGASMYTLFQIMTLEGWSEEVVRPVMAVYPWAWMFFIPFIIITSFAVLNLFIGIIVDAMSFVKDDKDVEQKDESEPLMTELKFIKDQLNKIEKSLDRNSKT